MFIYKLVIKIILIMNRLRINAFHYDKNNSDYPLFLQIGSVNGVETASERLMSTVAFANHRSHFTSPTL